MDAITGAFSYSGRYLARNLLDRGRKVLNFTNHPNRPHGFGDAISCQPLNFKDAAGLATSLRGVSTLYCTYWIRFDRHGGATHADALNNLKVLFAAARDAGVQKVVFSSHTRATTDSPFPYIRHKALAVEALRSAGLPSYGVVRPCGIFGDTPGESILMNNAAWVLRRFPVFTIVGDGSHLFQPVHVRDMAQLMADVADADGNVEVDAVGPEALRADELFGAIRAAVGSRTFFLKHVPARIVTAASQPLNWYTGDVLLDTHDLELLTSGLTVADDPHGRTGERKLTEWLQKVGSELGQDYISSVERYYVPDTGAG